MKKFIYLKYGDLVLKGNNRNEFINVLFFNVKKALKNFFVKLEKNFDNIKVFYDFNYEDQIIDILKLIPGILYVIKAIEVKTDINSIIDGSMEFCKKNSSFKIEVKRKYKNFLEQQEIKTSVASHLLSNVENLYVDVHNPNYIIWIEIKKEHSIIYSSKIRGVGGFPVGINGSCLSLISGGIDSCVSSYLMQKKGLKLDYLLFITSEVTKKTIEKIKKIISIITLDSKIQDSKLYVIDFTKIQYELMHAEDEKYRITLMRRSFYRIAELLCNKYKIDSICSGDSLGQVASQTMESINCINQVMKNKIIFRPLLAYDKNEIIEIANKINTYNISIQEHDDICSMFAPKSPSTKPNIEKILNNESKLILLNLLEEKVIESIRVVEFK